MRITYNSVLLLSLFIQVSCNQGQQKEHQLINQEELQLEIAKKELLISTVQAYIKGIKERDFSIMI